MCVGGPASGWLRRVDQGGMFGRNDMLTEYGQRQTFGNGARYVCGGEVAAVPVG